MAKNAYLIERRKVFHSSLRDKLDLAANEDAA